MFMARRDFLAHTGILAAGALWHRRPVGKIKGSIPILIRNQINGLKDDGCEVVFFAKDANYVLEPVSKPNGSWQKFSYCKDGEFIETEIRQLGYSIDVRYFAHYVLDGYRTRMADLTEEATESLFKSGVSNVVVW